MLVPEAVVTWGGGSGGGAALGTLSQDWGAGSPAHTRCTIPVRVGTLGSPRVVHGGSQEAGRQGDRRARPAQLSPQSLLCVLQLLGRPKSPPLCPLSCPFHWLLVPLAWRAGQPLLLFRSTCQRTPLTSHHPTHSTNRILGLSRGLAGAASGHGVLGTLPHPGPRRPADLAGWRPRC